MKRAGYKLFNDLEIWTEEPVFPVKDEKFRISSSRRTQKRPSSLSPCVREKSVSRKGVTFDKVILDLGSKEHPHSTSSTEELFSGSFSGRFREAPTRFFDSMRVTMEETQNYISLS
ncbi:hypothetical protein CEXT_659441 [Caerostris extrusa]|uniref:Uncharacterized protein n=1 Tax=Caerostris extrusa TaxID=172846 RepID=A0AAV4M606_CAEEX|nr:hypothetical protein CEXT_659441 [Caerostris extrusa]